MTEWARRVAGALEAALAVARRLGVPVETPRVLGEYSNLIVHLAPAPVVARVALVTASARPGSAWLSRELSVVRFLAGRGAPVGPPADAIDPGPHAHGRYQLTFWRLLEPSGRIDPAGTGRRLRELHGVLKDYDGALPSFDPRPEVEAICRVAERRGLDHAVALLRRLCDRIEVPDVPARPVHGDAHLGNVLAPDRWLDFEDVCAGPVEWDLACLVAGFHVFGEERRAGLVALEAYGDHDAALLATLSPLRTLYAAAWGCLGAALTGEPRPTAAHRLEWLRARYG